MLLQKHRSTACALKLQLQTGLHMAARRSQLGCWEAARVFWTVTKDLWLTAVALQLPSPSMHANVSMGQPAWRQCLSECAGAGTTSGEFLPTWPSLACHKHSCKSLALDDMPQATALNLLSHGVCESFGEPAGTLSSSSPRLVLRQARNAQLTWKFRSGSSQVTRHWMAYPLGGGMLSCSPMPRSDSFAPPAILIWACTRSTPVTSSVTVCSTCTAEMAASPFCTHAVVSYDLQCVLHQGLRQPHVREKNNCRHGRLVHCKVG